MGVAIEVRLVRPEAAQGRVRAVYDEMREVMGLSWVPDMLQAFAARPRYLEVAWRELRPLVGRAPFERAADDILRLGDEAVEAFPPEDHVQLLRPRRFQGDFDEIRRALDPFRFADPRLMLMATVLHDALRGGRVGTNTSPEASRIVGAPAYRSAIRFVRPDEAEGETLDILEEIRRDTALPLVAADYQALAAWPDYLKLAWHDLKRHVGSAGYGEAAIRIRNRAGMAMAELPGPTYADAPALREAGVQEGDLAEARALVRLFHEMLPGLVLSLAFFRAGLR